MVDFDELKDKAEDLVHDHGSQIEQGIDKVADLAENQFGHGGEIDKAVDKLKDMIPGE